MFPLKCGRDSCLLLKTRSSFVISSTDRLSKRKEKNSGIVGGNSLTEKL